MNSTRSSRLSAVVAASVLVLVGLTGCAESPAGADGASTLTLAQIKSPVQLLRNEVANRIPGNLVEDVVQPNDRSEPCESVETDPDGLNRTWKSGVLIVINTHAKLDVDEIVDDLVMSFEDQGWTTGEGATPKILQLTSENSFVTIDIATVKPDKVNDIGAQVQITTGGPCVVTEGRAAKSVSELGRAV